MFFSKKKIIFFFLAIFLLGLFKNLVFAQATDECQSMSGQSKVDCYQRKLDQAKNLANTYSSQIAIMDSQIKLTEARIEANEREILDLTLDIDTAVKKIDKLQGSLEKIADVLLNRIVATYKAGSVQPLEMFLSSADASNLLERLNYFRIVQKHDRALIRDVQQAKNDYANQKDIFEAKKKKIEKLKVQLETYNNQLSQEKQNKQNLLTQTRGSETIYQQLLAQAKEQLAGFARFVTSQGGPSILPAQPSPDGWYYNQRDERWGNNGIGNSGEPVWKYGCLLSSVAMVFKQQGENVTPADIAGNSSYFFQAYMLIPWAGGKFTSIWSSNLSEIDAKLAAGKSVIVGLNAGQYGTHFVVFKSGSEGSYVVNDPWYGPNIEFNSHYVASQIFQYGYLN